MESITIETRIKQIISEQLVCKLDQVIPQASFMDDLGADSLDCLELAMTLEEELGIEISDEDAIKLTHVGDVIIYVKAKVEEKANA